MNSQADEQEIQATLKTILTLMEDKNKTKKRHRKHQENYSKDVNEFDEDEERSYMEAILN